METFDIILGTFMNTDEVVESIIAEPIQVNRERFATEVLIMQELGVLA